jgi:hypothetical protein
MGPSTESARVLAPATASTTARACLLPVGFASALASLVMLPRVAESPRLVESYLGAAAALGAWAVVLYAQARSRDRTLRVEVVVKKQHYVQAAAQASIFLYWGWYWREVYHSAALIAAQLLFAYAFEALLVWSRRETYTLGFGPFPVVFSINLFLWFRADWFYLQFVMVALGFLAKELLHWNKDGRRAHIFNPSSFPLAVVSVILIVTRSTRMTWGHEIATTLLRAPAIYPFIFASGLVGQYLFGVTTMTLSAVVTMYGLGLAYVAVTGTHLFQGEYVPIAVFLGMHLLFTDPSTAPRTELGRIFFGVLYAMSVMVFARLLDVVGAPGFYDKLLPVPLLNLTIRAIDRAVRNAPLAHLDPAAIAPGLAPRRRNLVYMGVWALTFAALTAAHAWTTTWGSPS